MSVATENRSRKGLPSHGLSNGPFEGHRQLKSNPSLRGHRQTPPGFNMGAQAQLINHDLCNNHAVGSDHLRGLPDSTSDLETKLGGMTMNEWWSDDKSDMRRNGLLHSISGERQARAGLERKRNQYLDTALAGKIDLSKPILSDPTLADQTLEGTAEREGTLQASRAAFEAGLAGSLTMSEWWSKLSAFKSTKKSRLHSEILSFCKVHELSTDQVRSRVIAQEFLERSILEIWPNAEVHLYGSSATGLALPTSDVDIVVVLQPTFPTWPYDLRAAFDTGPMVSELHRKLERRPEIPKLTPVPHAKVPILKVVFMSGLACDISFDWHHNKQEQSVQIVKYFLKRYKALKPLCIVLKQFLRHQNLNEVFVGGIGSFCLTIMIVHFLQTLERSEGVAAASEDLGLVLVSFFMYYSQMHNYVSDVVTVTPGRNYSKQRRGWVNWNDPERLAVENPLNTNVDIGGGSYNIHDVRLKFSQARRALLTHWDEESILVRIFKTYIN